MSEINKLKGGFSVTIGLGDEIICADNIYIKVSKIESVNKGLVRVQVVAPKDVSIKVDRGRKSPFKNSEG